MDRYFVVLAATSWATAFGQPGAGVFSDKGKIEFEFIMFIDGFLKTCCIFQIWNGPDLLRQVIPEEGDASGVPVEKCFCMSWEDPKAGRNVSSTWIDPMRPNVTKGFDIFSKFTSSDFIEELAVEYF